MHKLTDLIANNISPTISRYGRFVSFVVYRAVVSSFLFAHSFRNDWVKHVYIWISLLYLLLYRNNSGYWGTPCALVTPVPKSAKKFLLSVRHEKVDLNKTMLCYKGDSHWLNTFLKKIIINIYLYIHQQSSRLYKTTPRLRNSAILYTVCWDDGDRIRNPLCSKDENENWISHMRINIIFINGAVVLCCIIICRSNSNIVRAAAAERVMNLTTTIRNRGRQIFNGAGNAR